jgi:hypothetical protein
MGPEFDEKIYQEVKHTEEYLERRRG